MFWGDKNKLRMLLTPLENKKDKGNPKNTTD